MSDLIEALTIFCEYADLQWPTTCEHDCLYVMDVGKDQPTEAHKRRLEELGFHWDDGLSCWASYRFGSA